MAKAGKGKKGKKGKVSSATSNKSDASNKTNTDKESLSAEEAVRKGYYWRELRQQASFMQLNQMINRPNYFSYYIAFPMEMYRVPIGGEGEEEQNKKGKKKGKKK